MIAPDARAKSERGTERRASQRRLENAFAAAKGRQPRHFQIVMPFG